MVGILRLLLIWRLLRPARRPIAAALVLAAVTLAAHAIAGSGRPPDHHTGSTLRSLRHALAPVSGRLEKVFAVDVKTGDGR
jgi:O-antigen ligase